MALLAVIVIGPQAYLGYATNVARDEVNLVFAPSTAGSGAWNPAPTPGPGASAEPAASSAPTSVPALASSRVNVLLIGVDAGVGRTTFLTDTLIVASLDPVAGTVSLLSLARDTVDVPLPGGGMFSPKINSLLSYARLHPGEFPGSTGDGHDVLMAAIGTLLGLDIHLYAQVNLGGFVALVNSVGGVDVNVANSFCDPTYHGYGFTNGFAITAGRHHLDGDQALAYARVRKAAGESDFTRQARQQEILSGVRDAVVGGGFLNDPIGFLKAVGQTVETNIPRSMVVQLADAAQHVDRTKTYRAVITHPLVAPGFDVRGSIQIPDVAAIRALVAQLFPPTGTLPELALSAPPPASTTVAGSGVSSCLPAAMPKPTARPTPQPAETPGTSPSPSASSSDASSPSPEPSASPAP
jgi:LCP family protein required for cell wall assembly